MERNSICKIFGTDYREMTKELLKRADLIGEIHKKRALVRGRDAGQGKHAGRGRDAAQASADRPFTVGIKPNLVCPTPASYGATTHTEVVAGIIEYLAEGGISDVLIAEGSWVGDRTSEAYEYCGYRELCETYGVLFVDTQKEKWHGVDAAGLKLDITDVCDRIDFLINVPVLKGHCQTRMTCALKNMKGLLPNREKRHFHAMGLHKPIAHLNTAIRQDFIVVDHICGDLDFEEGGRPVVRNCVMAALDPVLVDSYACRLLNLTPDDVPYVRMAERLGVGSADLDGAEIVLLGEDGSDELPLARRVLDVSYAVEEVDSCSACYSSLIGALDRLKEEGLLEALTVPVGIGQGMQGKRGKLGVGRCTGGFDFSIPGCPPDEEAVYEGLRRFLRA